MSRAIRADLLEAARLALQRMVSVTGTYPAEELIDEGQVAIARLYDAIDVFEPGSTHVAILSGIIDQINEAEDYACFDPETMVVPNYARAVDAARTALARLNSLLEELDTVPD